MKRIIDGNTACAIAAYHFTEVAGIYPITPSSDMAELVDEMSAKGELNIFGKTAKVITMQSEAGAAGLIHGALQGGSLSTTFTASQGLLLMLPTLYKAVGERLPLVMHVAARTIATHSLSIMGDHSDVYAARPTGVCILASSNPQDAHNLAIVAHLSAIKARYPFLHFFDGFRTSHEITKVDLLSNLDIKAITEKDYIESFKKRNIFEEASTRGTNENGDLYFQHLEAKNKSYGEVSGIVNEYMKKINALTGSSYAPFTYYGQMGANKVIVAMGSVCNTIKEYIDNSKERIGLIEVHLYRPFDVHYLIKVLPFEVKKIAVLDRAKEFGSVGEPLYLDITAALKGKNVRIIRGRYGISGKNTTINDIAAVYHAMDNDRIQEFTLGITDDVTKLSLTRVKVDKKVTANELAIYGIGSDSSVTMGRNILNLLGDKYEVQGYFQYDSNKSNGITKSHLRFNNNPIRSSYYIDAPKYIIINYDHYLTHLNMFKGLRDDAIVLINTQLDADGLCEIMNESSRRALTGKTIFLIDANKIASKYNLSNKISSIMTYAFFKVSKLLPDAEVKKELIHEIKTNLNHKGKKVINDNINALDEINNSITPAEIVCEPSSIHYDINKYEAIANFRGNSLPVSDFIDIEDGIFKPQAITSNYSSSLYPEWIKANCIECGKCSIICPHAVIRLVQLEKSSVLHPEYFTETNDKDLLFSVMVNQKECTGCGLCIKECPGRKGLKALAMVDAEDARLQAATLKYFEMENVNNLPVTSLKGTQLNKPLFSYSKACGGCGQTAYLKLLTQIVGDKLIIANATGCSSIYGGSVPYFPYQVPWINSLFEDNAEFAYGLEVANELNEAGKSIWAVGGDGWAYDIGFSGIDQVLASGANVNMLVLDSEVYSNTGGQGSKSSPKGVTHKFVSDGKATNKKDLASIAMTYDHIYVATINLSANPNQAIKAINEAVNFDGPALIIAYTACIAHGIKGGMENSSEATKNATKCGYWPLFRYNDGEFSLDSKEVNFDQYEAYLLNEKRYAMLNTINPKSAKELIKANKENAIKRYEMLTKKDS